MTVKLSALASDVKTILFSIEDLIESNLGGDIPQRDQKFLEKAHKQFDEALVQLDQAKQRVIRLPNEQYVELYSDLTARIIEALGRGTVVTPWKSDGQGGECYTEEAQDDFNAESDEVCRILSSCGVHQAITKEEENEQIQS